MDWAMFGLPSQHERRLFSILSFDYFKGDPSGLVRLDCIDYPVRYRRMGEKGGGGGDCVYTQSHFTAFFAHTLP